MEKYGWTPNEIADMTSAQQYAALGLSTGSQHVAVFKTYEQFLSYQSGLK